MNTNKRMTQIEKKLQRKQERQMNFEASPVFEGELFYSECNANHERYVTIFCKYNRSTKQITYAQVMYKVNKKDVKLDVPVRAFDREKHSKEAKSRFAVRPVVVNDVNEMKNFEEFRKMVRILPFKHKGYTHGKLATQTSVVNEAC
ncbi:MAG TPA: hypothetical protein VJ201_01230 [Candidatus Babeliales bacterium]|nr:hypothetical protein [Candidatus Babeliales bacterium]